MWLWLKNPVPKRNPGKWKHGPKPAVCPSCIILSHRRVGERKGASLLRRERILHTGLSELGRASPSETVETLALEFDTLAQAAFGFAEGKWHKSAI